MYLSRLGKLYVIHVYMCVGILYLFIHNLNRNYFYRSVQNIRCSLNVLRLSISADVKYIHLAIYRVLYYKRVVIFIYKVDIGNDNIE